MAAVCCGIAALCGCVPPIESGLPLASPADVEAEALQAHAISQPSRVGFDWSYSDRRGAVRGEGVARINPPDSLRLDLFTSGEVAMAVALRDGSVGSLGQIESIELPDTPFLYAMVGLFRPAAAGLPRGYVVRRDTILVYALPSRGARYFFLQGGRLSKVEERRRGRTERRVTLEWSVVGEWPDRAEYRDFIDKRRVSWVIGETRIESQSYAPNIYDLPNVD